MNPDRSRLVRSLYDSFNTRNFEHLASVVTDDFEWLNVPFGVRYRGPDGARRFTREWTEAIPDSRITVSGIIVGEDTVVAEFLFRGTHRGTLNTPTGPLAATGQRVEIPAVEVIHFKGDKIDSTHAYFDAATLMRQLGLIPSLAAQQQPRPQPSAS